MALQEQKLQTTREAAGGVLRRPFIAHGRCQHGRRTHDRESTERSNESKTKGPRDNRPARQSSRARLWLLGLAKFPESYPSRDGGVA